MDILRLRRTVFGMCAQFDRLSDYKYYELIAWETLFYLFGVLNNINNNSLWPSEVGTDVQL